MGPNRNIHVSYVWFRLCPITLPTKLTWNSAVWCVPVLISNHSIGSWPMSNFPLTICLCSHLHSLRSMCHMRSQHVRAVGIPAPAGYDLTNDNDLLRPETSEVGLLWRLPHHCYHRWENTRLTTFATQSLTPIAGYPDYIISCVIVFYSPLMAWMNILSEVLCKQSGFSSGFKEGIRLTTYLVD